MQRKSIVLLYGFLSWLIPFIFAITISGLRESNRPLFESIMPVVVTTCAAWLGARVIAKFEVNSIRTGAAIGLLWAVMNIGLDLPFFSWGPMKMAPAEYFADIGLVYAIHPVVILGMVRTRKDRAPLSQVPEQVDYGSNHFSPP